MTTSQGFSRITDMSSGSVFDRLVAELSTNERKELLDKCRRSYTLADEPLYFSRDEDRPVVVAQAYTETGIITRLVVFFVSLFTGRERLEVMEERLLKQLIRRIEREYPGLLQSSEHLALDQLKYEIESLQNAAAVFRNPLETVLENSRGEFIAFLAGLEYEIVQEKLIEVTEPAKRSEEFADMDDRKIKEKLEFDLENLFLEFTDSERERMSQNMRSLFLIGRFARFSFKSILDQFDGDGAPGCPLDKLEEPLEKLLGILRGLRIPPETGTIQALFVFLYQKELEDREFDIETKLKNQMERVEEALGTIRHFNTTVPLLDILKYIKMDINFDPEITAGDDDWFVQFKNFWKERLERNFNRFAGERKKAQFLESAAEFLGLTRFPLLDNYRNGSVSPHMRVRHQYRLGFIHAYVDKFIQNKYKRQLQIILIDGEFYKDANRKDFTDAYNMLTRIPDRVGKIEQDLSTGGMVGRLIMQTDSESITNALKSKKIENILQRIEPEVYQIVKGGFDNLELLKNVINGILHGEVGGKFDTLANIGYISGRDNNKYKSELNQLITNIAEAQENLDRLATIE